jgi:hypothetical protein
LERERTMAKKNKAPKLSFRQRLRNDAAQELSDLKRKFEEVTESELIAANTGISKYDVFRLLSGGQTKTLEERLITELANEKEAALESIYNKQIGLDLGDSNGDV